MKIKFRAISLIFALLTLAAALFSCGVVNDFSDDTTEPTVTDAPKVEEVLGATSEKGKVEFNILGVRTVPSFANIEPDDGNAVICVYVEIINKTLKDYYVLRNCLDTKNSELLYVDEELLPTDYDNFGGYVASGKRRLFLLCFEDKTDWFRVNLDYNSFDKNLGSDVLMGYDYREEKAILTGDETYPIDKRTDDMLKQDLVILDERLVDKLWATPNKDKANTYEKLLVESENGRYFSDVDYEDQSVTVWKTLDHLKKLQELISYYGEERLENDATARGIALSVLDFWLAKDFQNPNNYIRMISVPSQLVYCANMLKPYLSESQLERINTIVGRGSLKGTSDPSVSYGVVQYAEDHTGANLLSLMEITVYHALLLDDYDLALAAVARTAGEISIVKRGAEGMQADGSFFQHGALLCSGGSYGSVYARGVANFIVYMHGTLFSLPEENIELFIDHLLDGQRYFHRGNGANYFSIGRAAVTSIGGKEIKVAVDTLLKLDDLYRLDEIVEYEKSFSDPTKSFDSTKYFPHSYTMVNSSPEAYIAFRGAHAGFILTEAFNTQNVLGYNLSYGANTCYLYSGDEYRNIGAVMDYSMFPGTTTYMESDEQLYARYTSDYNKTWGRETYKGEHCDGLLNEEKGIGAMYMELINDGITGKLSFITYDNALIALGAGLDLSKTSESEIRTTVDQTEYNNASIGSAPLKVGSGAVTVDKKDVVYNGAFAYYNLGNTDFTVEAKSMTNNIARTYHGSGRDTDVTRDVLQLYISYGNKLENASYAYAVVSNANGNAPKSVSELNILKITNTVEVQAVEFENGTAVVIFHKAGEFVLSGGERLTADKASIVIK